MKVMWLGVFDKKPWRAEYAILKQFRAKGVQVICVNKRETGFNIADIRNLIAHSDLVFLQNGKTFRAEWLNEIRKPIVYWATEASLSVAHHILIGGRIPDFVISHSRQVFDYCKQRGIPTSRIHNAFDSSQYYRINAPMVWDICVAGNTSKRRRKIYKRLYERLHNEAKIGVLSSYTPSQANQMYNQSRIVLHIHAINETYLPSRFFEVIPTAAVFICESMGRNYDERIGRGFFDEFTTISDLCNKCMRIIRDPSLQKRMASAANAVSLKHTWAVRTNEIIAAFRAVLNK